MSGFAIVSGIFAAEDIEAETRRLLKDAQELCVPGTIDRLRRKISERCPIVQCITNIVTVNDCANALLAVGATPTMAHHPGEMEDFATFCDSLVCNMGATESTDAMIASGKASGRPRPIIIDPVGSAYSTFRRKKSLEIIREVHPDCIRGNAKEIRALATDHNTGLSADRGITKDDVSGTGMPDVVKYAMQLSRQTGAIVIASGETDYAVDGTRVYEVHGGTVWMTRVTGTGCMLSALLGAFLAVENTALGAAACCAMMNSCAEKAAEQTAKENGGTGTFHIRLIDALSGPIL